MILALFSGLGVGLGLIVAIGAQNVFVLRQGLRREHALAVATVCAVSDAILIAAGVAGLGFLVSRAPWLVDAARWAGAVFLLAYAARALWRATRRTDDALDTTDPTAKPTARGRAGTLLTALALTWLNPHVYLDTVFLLGSVSSTYGAHRWWFAAGAMTASVLWFFGLAWGARLLGRWLSTRRAWRILDIVIAIVMAGIAVSLVWPH